MSVNKENVYVEKLMATKLVPTVDIGCVFEYVPRYLPQKYIESE